MSAAKTWPHTSSPRRRGTILINANLDSSPPLIRSSVKKLGFRWTDTKILLNSQAHFDHMAGAAQILRETGAKNMVMEGDADVAESGGRTDFLAASGSLPPYVPTKVDRILRDGETVELGGVTLTAQDRRPHARLHDVELSRSSPRRAGLSLARCGHRRRRGLWSDFHIVDRGEQRASYPGIADDFARAFRVLQSLPCDIFLGAHGSYFDLKRKLPRLAEEGPKVFLDPTGYGEFVAHSQAEFERALKKEQEAARP